MILLAINLFLRFDEVCNVKIGDFDEQTFLILESGIQNPSIYVKGKSDKKKHLFALRQNKQFCNVSILPVLLLYIARKKFASKEDF